MLLRRVMQHVKDQNWFAVGLDLLIVVVGVFFGQVAGVSLAGHLSEEETLDRIANDDRLLAAISSNRLWVFYHLVVLDELRNQALVVLDALEANTARCDFAEDSL